MKKTHSSESSFQNGRNKRFLGFRDALTAFRRGSVTDPTENSTGSF
jgi:hypothetical protein